MATVRNWQLGRDMEYPFPEVRPRRQFGMVMDTNKCIACQTCTVACKTTWTPGRGQELMLWNNVESKPYGFFPLGWDVRILERLGVQSADGPVYRGRTLFEAAPEGERVLGFLPDSLDYAHPNVGEDDSVGSMSRGAALSVPHLQWMYYLPRICNHCTFPACLGACPRQSVYKRPEDGVVLIDQQRCRGYRECVRGCPYKKSYFNPLNRISEKCIGCYPRLEQGLQTQCTVTCIGKIRLQGFVAPPERAREDNPLDYLVHVARVALPLYPQFGLEPNVYYVPPIHVPDPFLVQMFGPGAPAAVQAYRNARNDKTLAGLFALFGSTERTIAYFKIVGDQAVAFDDQRKETVRVPIYEPVHVRPAQDRLYQVMRSNTT